MSLPLDCEGLSYGFNPFYPSLKSSSLEVIFLSIYDECFKMIRLYVLRDRWMESKLEQNCEGVCTSVGVSPGLIIPD